MAQQKFETETLDKFTLAQFILSSVVVLLTPLYRGGNRPLVIAMVEIVAIILLFFIIARPEIFRKLSRWQIVLLLIILFYPLLYLLPIPFFAWMMLPGHELYASVISIIDRAEGWYPVSLNAYASQYYWLFTLSVVIIFVAMVSMPTHQLVKLIYLVLALAILQSLLGLIQFGVGNDEFWRLGMHDKSNALGTFPNRNHLAGFLEMLLPLGIALLIAKISFFEARQNYARSWRKRLLGWFRGNAVTVFFYSFLIAIVLLAIVFTRSRTGIAIMMIEIFVCAILFFRRIGGHQGTRFVSAIVFLAIVIAVEIGLAPVLQRFGFDSAMSDLRWPLFESMIKAIGEFFPLGSGPGTFSHVFPAFQSLHFDAKVMFAHNDYLQWFMESGVFAVAILLLFLILYLYQWIHIFGIKLWSQFNFLQAGAGVGILAILIHSFTDFNLHIPGNMLIFALLCAVFIHKEDEKERKATRTPIRQSKVTSTEVRKRKSMINPDVKNPFLED